VLWVYVTCKNWREAKKIGETAVREHLAACANIFGKCDSIFFWKRKLCKEKEAVLILKTSERTWKKLEQRIKQLHSYEVPCIEALKVERAEKNYLKWVEGECGEDSD
jgi:periplasmic divalent cation tolerance protein